MSDIQARVAEVLAEHMPLGFRCECGWDSHQSATYATEHAAHVAAVLAEAGLLVNTDGRARLRLANALAGAERERDAARAELAKAKDRFDELQRDLSRALVAAADAERRGAVAALREAVDEYAKGQGYQRMVAANLRARADRIEGDDHG